MTAQAQQHVAGAEILAAGSALSPDLMKAVVEVRVHDSRKSPAWALIRATDTHDLHFMDSHPFQIGTEVEVKLSAIGDRSRTSVFKGEVVAIEPEFSTQGAQLVVRAYDKSLRLARGRRIRKFTQEKASDIVQSLVSDAGLSAGSIQDTGTVYDTYFQQNETDLELIRRLERRHDYEFSVRDGSVDFKPAKSTDSTAGPELRWGSNLLSFRPRISAAQEVGSVEVRGWDVESKQAAVGSASSGEAAAELGLQLSSLETSRGGSVKHTVSDLTVKDQGEATKLAQAIMDRGRATAVEADGQCLGDPKLRAGMKVQVSQVGTKLSGKYHLTTVTHIYRSGGYECQFVAGGRSDRGMLDLMTRPDPKPWGRSLVVGIVTNTNDTDKMGRVKVKFPALDDQLESDWARVVSLMAGPTRGVWMLPQVDDEVVVAFENDDPRRPIVLGAVFNGRDKGGDDLLQNNDGSFAVVATEKGFIKTAKDLTIKSDQKMIVEITSDQTNTVKGKQEEKITGNFTHETSGSGSLKASTSYTLEAGSTLTLKGANVEISAQGSLTLKGATVSIEAQTTAALKGLQVDVQGSAMANVKGGIVNLG